MAFGLIKQLMPHRLKSANKPPAPSAQAYTSSVNCVQATAVVPPIKNGTVSVTNNAIIVTDPDLTGSFAALTIPKHPNVVVTVDGDIAVGQVVLTSSRKIRITFSGQRAPTRRFTAKVSEDLLSVVVTAHVECGKAHQIRDMEPERSGVLDITERDVPPQPTPQHEILMLFKDSGYQGNIDYTAIAELCTSQRTLERVAISGTPPQPGVAAKYIKVHLPTEPDPILRKMRLSTVSIGTTVAIYEPEIKGVPGKNVYGNDIPVNIGNHMPTLGQGVIEVNGHIVASRSGRLVFTKKKIDVVPELVLSNDVDPKQGKIEFDGSVVVHGSVLDGASIRASGTITIYGNVMGATVLGEQGVIITGNAVGSKIWSGYTQFLYKELKQLIKSILGDLDYLHSDCISLLVAAKNRSTTIRIPLIVQTLLEQRHAGLDLDLTRFAEDYADLIQVDSDYRELADYLRAMWQGVHRTRLTDSDVLQLIHKFTGYNQTLAAAMSADPAVIRVSSTTTSSLQASGNIIITGAGTYSSTLQSAGSITIQGSVRGGFLIAEKAVRARELGTPYGAECSVRVADKSGFVWVQTRHINTLLDVSGMRNRNLFTEFNVHMTYQERGDTTNAG